MSRASEVASTVREFTAASLHDALMRVIEFYGCTADDALRVLSPDEGKAHRRRWQRDHYRSRRVVMNHFTLLPGMVVHHQDENPSNASVNNLRVFATNADHIAYHHGKPVKPIWTRS